MPTSPRNLVFTAGLLLLIGAFMPWVTITSAFFGLSQSLTGIEGDGMFSAGAGIILLLISFSAKPTPGKNYSIPGIIVSVLAFLLLFGKPGALKNSSDADGVLVSIGFGLYLSILGSILGVIGSFIKPQIENEIQKAENQTSIENAAPTEILASAEIPTQPKKE